MPVPITDLTVAGANQLDATVVVVSYRSRPLDLSWLPLDAPVVVVHNDASLDPGGVNHPFAIHLGDRSNIGFGRAVNVALARVQTSRIVLINPDTNLSVEHWEAFVAGGPHEIVVVPMVDADGRRTSMVNHYPTPASLVLTALRVGRLFPRHGVARAAFSPLLGEWGRQHAGSLRGGPGQGGRSWPASAYWPCAAACSYPTDLIRRVGGFDPAYFLYLEDVDLVRRMASVDPRLRLVQPDVAPGIHQVSGSSNAMDERRWADLEQARSAERYAACQAGLAWSLAGLLVSRLARSRARGLARVP